MAVRRGTPLVALALAVLGALFVCSSFVPAPPSATPSSTLRGSGAAGVVATASGVLLASTPQAALAVTEKEWNIFGLFFSAFFLVFWVAALGRMLTTGKL